MSSGRVSPKVTVIIPCYNRERFIRQTIDSALSQTYPNIDIVTVDDGSTDSTRAVLETYSNRLLILEHPRRANRGQSAAINLGMRATRSDYIAVLDSDDVWEPNKIERQIGFLEKNSLVDLVYSNGYAIDEKGKILYKIFPRSHVETGAPERVLLECPLACPSGYLFRRFVFQKAGYFDESLRSAQDHDMVLRLAEVTKLAYLDETLWYYRRHSEALSYKHAKRRWRAGFIILKKACDRYPYTWDIRRRRLAVLHFRLGQCLAEEHKYLQSCIRFVLSGLLDPARALDVIFSREKLTDPH